MNDALMTAGQIATDATAIRKQAQSLLKMLDQKLDIDTERQTFCAKLEAIATNAGHILEAADRIH
jgi:hypothetical protein